MGIIMDFWNIGKDLFDVSDKFKEAEKDRKEAASKLFNAIGDVLKDTYEKLLHQTYPAGNCQQLLLYGHQLYDKTKDVIGEEKAHELAEKILAAHKVEQLYHELENTNTSQSDLEILDEASGFFKATANIILL